MSPLFEFSNKFFSHHCISPPLNHFTRTWGYALSHIPSIQPTPLTPSLKERSFSLIFSFTNSFPRCSHRRETTNPLMKSFEHLLLPSEPLSCLRSSTSVFSRLVFVFRTRENTLWESSHSCRERPNPLDCP